MVGGSCFGGKLKPKVDPDVFRHGVASFDPLADRVILWTRLTLPPKEAESTTSVKIQWQLAIDLDFKDIIQSGFAEASEELDWTVSVDVSGLRASTRYRYRFLHGGTASRTGTTRTFAAPGDEQESLTFALLSCANFGFGHFHVHDLAARLDGLELVVFGGDYIYEYKDGEYPDPGFIGRKGLRPSHKLETLRDYRDRYACHRELDPALRDLHAKAPWVCVWDDHELSDSCWMDGAETWEGSAEEWHARVPVALQAYAEWVPVRGLDPRRPDPKAGFRTFSFGDLATLIVLETRVSARSEPPSVEKTEFYKLVAETKQADWDDDAIADARKTLLAALADPGRRMIGDEQLKAVRDAVRDSTANEQPWQLVASQIIMGTLTAPLLQQTLRIQPKLFRKICTGALNLAMDDGTAGEEGARLARMYLGLGKYGLPMNPDAWDGYRAERQRLFDALDAPGASPIVLSGDSHNAWVQEIRDDRNRRVGVEFAGPGVSSIGAFEDIYSRFEAKSKLVPKLFPLELFTPWIEDALKAANPSTLHYANVNERGVVFVKATKQVCHVELHFVSPIKKKTYKHHCGASFDVERGDPGRVHHSPRYLTIDGVIPKRTRTKTGTLIHAVHDISAAWQQY